MNRQLQYQIDKLYKTLDDGTEVIHNSTDSLLSTLFTNLGNPPAITVISQYPKDLEAAKTACITAVYKPEKYYHPSYALKMKPD
jgi:hypothetical protein